VKTLIEQIAKQLNSLNAKQEAWWLLEKVTGKKESELLLHKSISPSEQEQLDKLIKERVVDKKPLQYILGSVPFLDLEIKVQPPILIPRPETEEWTGNLIKQLSGKTNLKILDLCSGSGCIALALAKAFIDAEVIGLDILEEAIQLSEENKVLNNVKNIKFLQSDLYNAVSGLKFDVIVSNPPYVTEEEWSQLEPEVKNWESKTALIAEDNGLGIYKKIISDAHVYLNKNGLIALEIGASQGEAVSSLLKDYGFVKIQIHKDICKKDRLVTAQNS